MARKTPATRTLDELGIAYSLHTYDYDRDASSVGLQAAEALGVGPARMLKTLMASADGKPVCAVVPSDCQVSMRKLAAAVGAKSAQMMPPADAERITGYRVGGISPFGQKRRVPIVFEARALVNDTVFVNGGQRGLQIELDPRLAVAALEARAAELAADP